MNWKTKGMNRDLSVSAFSPEFAFENRNLRLGANDGNATMSWVNEKGTASVSLRNAEYWSKVIAAQGYTKRTYKNPNDSSWTHHPENTENEVIIGTPIGTSVLNHQLVVFTTDTLHNHDYIYVLRYIDNEKMTMSCMMLFGSENMSLGFSIDHPIETLASYESDAIQKVYWTDGVNQPRVVNISGNVRFGNNTQFDFVPTLQLQETVYVKKLLGASGMFAPGVIQYALTYYTKFGQESNIFYTSPLQYISYRDRGGSPEDKVENAFKITIERVDKNFDYLRIYSIQRTSINATPICKRIQDISISELEENEYGNLVASYIDTGTNGDSVDPTELLYKGGEVISAYTLEQKDNTLFLGNLEITRPQIDSALRDTVVDQTMVQQDRRTIIPLSVSTGSYIYANQLTSFDSTKNMTVPCGGFKHGDTYRLGVQFQYSTGKWSDPVYIKDDVVQLTPRQNEDNTSIVLPIFKGIIRNGGIAALIAKGYKRVRGVVVFPEIQDRNVLCQGIVNPTLFTTTQRIEDKSLYSQASWFFRASNGGHINSDCSVSPIDTGYLAYTHMGIGPSIPKSGCWNYDPNGVNDNIRTVEVQGQFDQNNKFQVDKSTVTFHSPDIEFDTQLSLVDYSSSKFRQVGYSVFSGTMSDIDIQTETPAISSQGGGFVHKLFTEQGSHGIVSGLFYDDYIVDDVNEDIAFRDYGAEKSSCKWMVYLWNKTGSLNNDITRPADKGTRSAVLKKKVISNLRYGNTTFANETDSKDFVDFPQVFSSNEVSIIKMGTNIYKGNIDTSIIPDESEGNFLAFQSDELRYKEYVTTPFTSNSWWKTFSRKPTENDASGTYRYFASGWEIRDDEHIGDLYLDLVIKKDPVRIKYKSTPHLVFTHSGGMSWNPVSNSLPVVEILQNVDDNTRFGGKSNDALKENIWVPCGEPKLLSDVNESGNVEFYWEYGDTYYQRWDCLKTYAFTPEDINQVVEIGSFMLESRTNVDGRYDRNRGQQNNLNMSPVNFNLLNPIYSQKDNFFSYRIQDDFYYINTKFPNQITWSKTKESGADVDLWTNTTLASTLEMDGNKGEVTRLKRFRNMLVCFQDSGVAQIRFNGNVVLQSTQGVPVEIANSGKVDGKDYISDSIGCSDKWSIQTGTNGLYFMDSNGKDIYLFNGQIANLSGSLGFNAWSKMYIPSGDVKWTPTFPRTNEKSAFVTYYDKINQEMLFINRDRCLAYSEKFNCFTSFYDYNGTPYFENIDDTGIWLRANTVWRHQAGDYCRFFGSLRPYSMVLIGNPDPSADKIFTNVEFRACVDGDGTFSGSSFTPYLPFDSLDTWNEYQHGIVYLNNMKGHSAMKHHTLDNEASLKRKFRIWRCDIPRDNGDNVDTFDETFDETFHSLSRLQKHPLDRMRNSWLYLRLRKDEESSNRRVEVHDITMTYFV